MKKSFLLPLALLGASVLPGACDAADTPKILVAYFSRTGENYNVGYIRKGNTEIVAEILAEKTGADLFRIEPVKKYQDNYKEAVETSRRELAQKARPALTAAVPDFDSYDVIFLGYPIWCGDMPMPVYTFLESYDFSGKTIIPFCTHEGSGLAGTPGKIKNTVSGVNVTRGLSVYGTAAQQNRTEAERLINEFLRS